MYLACTICLLTVYVGWTTSAAVYTTRGDQKASHAVLAMIFLYSPAYNLGYNALTYSESHLNLVISLVLILVCSVPGRTVPVHCSFQGYHYIPMVGSRSRLLQPICQPDWNRKRRLEVLHQLLVCIFGRFT